MEQPQGSYLIECTIEAALELIEDFDTRQMLYDRILVTVLSGEDWFYPAHFAGRDDAFDEFFKNDLSAIDEDDEDFDNDIE
jgi:hypothetical protein